MITMTDGPDENAVTQKGGPSNALSRLAETQMRGGAFAWSGLAVGILWWLAAFGGAIALVGWSELMAAKPALILAGCIGLLIPGLLMILAGLLARENARAGAANALVLEAAAKLLLPAEQTSAETTVFANEMARASAEVDKSMGHALSAMKAMAGEIGDERQRLESVSYASADNAKELGARLSNERAALETLARDLREQTDTLSDAIPRQASLMVESARTAANEVGQAEEGLQKRLESLDMTGRTLAQKIAAMDALAAEAGERNETLLFAIARMEEKLEQSRKTVETASRAGELAAAAAGTTGDRLMEAVRTALDGARDANAEIHKSTLDASENAARSLAELRDAGDQAAAAIRAAGMAARAELDITERRAEQASQNMYTRSQSLGSQPSNGNGSDLGRTLQAGQPATAPKIRTTDSKSAPVPQTAQPASPSTPTEDDLFEANADRMARAMLDDAKKKNGVNGHTGSEQPMMLKRGLDDDIFDGANAYPVSKQARNGGDSISDIIADMEHDEGEHLSREDTADALIQRFSDSGIRLTDIFRPKHKKKIAVMARKGDKQRRSATNGAASRQVDRIRKRLRSDSQLMGLARNFVALEENDALNALENTHSSNKNASARLATYLLLDAALD